MLLNLNDPIKSKRSLYITRDKVKAPTQLKNPPSLWNFKFQNPLSSYSLLSVCFHNARESLGWLMVVRCHDYTIRLIVDSLH